MTEFAEPSPIMEMSADIGEIAKALPKAQAAMGEVFKTANNPAFRTKYADLGAVVEAVVPALNKVGISLLQPVSYDGETVKVGTMLLHESGQWVRCTLAIPLSKRDAHGIGSAVTYGKRYGLQSMSGVAPEDDDGNAASTKGEPKDTPTPQTRHVDPKPATLQDRANRLATTIQAVKTVADLDKAYKLASGLLAELDDKEPEMFAFIEKMRADRDAELSQKVAA